MAGWLSPAVDEPHLPVPAGHLPPGVAAGGSHSIGSYYCAHTFFLLHQWGLERPRLCDANGVPRVGFIHVPADAATDGAIPRDRDRAFQANRAVLRAAIHGLAQGRTSLRLLLTGFGPFGDVRSNPSGDFLRDWTQLDSTLRGWRALERDGHRAKFGQRTRQLEVHKHVLAVDDSCFATGGDGGLPALIGRIDPDAIIATGVHRGDQFQIEVTATDAGLRNVAGAWRHVEEERGQPQSRVVNACLLRALEVGLTTTQE